MQLSEKLEQIKFSKSVAGYSVKEVDGFVADFLMALREEEELMRVLRTKLSAFEAHAAEIERREQESLRILEAAKAEGESVLAAARKNAEAILAEAKTTAEVRARAAEAHAAEQIAEAERRSAARVQEAKQNAEMILAAADRKGRTMLSEAKSIATAQSQNAKALAAECVAFEARFRAIAADTVRALAALKDDAPKPIVTSAPEAEPIAVAEPFSKPAVHSEKPKPEPETAPESVQEETLDMTATQDVSFAGGQPVASYTGEAGNAPRRKLYDTVTVTYEEDDGFSDIRRVMDDTDGKKKKNPAHFCE